MMLLPKVLEGLRRLEYRGYDSAGLAALFPERDGMIETEKTTGYVSDLVSKAMVGSQGLTFRLDTRGGLLMAV